jgi:hypothetical protein
MIRVVGAQQLQSVDPEATAHQCCCVIALATLIGLGAAWWATGSLARHQRLAVLIGAPAVTGVAGLILWTLCSGRRAAADDLPGSPQHVMPPAYEDLSAPPQEPAASVGDLLPRQLVRPQPEVPQAAAQPLPDAPAKHCPLIARTAELRIAQMAEPVRVNATLIRRIARVGLQGFELARPFGTSDAAMLALVEYCHTLQLPSDLDSALDLLRLVSQLELADLKARLELALEDRLDASSAARIRTMALSTRSEWLVRHAEAELHLHTQQFIGFGRRQPVERPRCNALFSYLDNAEPGSLQLGTHSVHPEAVAVACPTKWSEIQFLAERGQQASGSTDLIRELVRWIYQGFMPATATFGQLRDWLANSPSLSSFMELAPDSQIRRLRFGANGTERTVPAGGHQYTADCVECDRLSPQEMERLASRPISGLVILRLNECTYSEQILDRLIRNNRGLRILEIRSTGTEIDPDRFAAILIALRRLQHLSLNGQQVNWAQLSKTTPDLVVLHYSHGSWGACHLTELAEALPFWPNLGTLDITELDLASVQNLGPSMGELTVRRGPADSTPRDALCQSLGQLLPRLHRLDWRFLDQRLIPSQMEQLRRIGGQKLRSSP